MIAVISIIRGIKNRLGSFIRRIIRKFHTWQINRWRYSLRKRINNRDFTIICNNCIGGVIYHNLGCRFDSPTINLYIKGKDYLNFVKHLKFYAQCDMNDVTDEMGYGFPVGELVSTDPRLDSIKVYFQHYDTFEIAKETWYRRISRVHYDNIYFIWEFYDDMYDISLVYEFDSLPCNKIAITHRTIVGLKNCVTLSYYNGLQDTGKVLCFDGLFGKRYLDEWDYVSWLNK